MKKKPKLKMFVVRIDPKLAEAYAKACKKMGRTVQYVTAEWMAKVVEKVK
jgi:hypothetical protein